MKRTAIQIIRQLVTGPKDFWQLIAKQDSCIKEFVEELKNLEGEGLIKREGGIFKLRENSKKTKSYLNSLCDVCENGIDPGKIGKLKKTFEEVVKERPLPCEDYDQGFMRAEDTLKRVLFMYERGDLEGKNIFILGDDDLLSLAIGLMGVANLITVVEIDKRITDFIEKRAEQKKISSIEVVEYNVLDPLPQKFCEKYHTFVTDPVETWAGLRLFLQRCIKTLKGEGCSGYFGLTHLEASLKKWHQIEKFLLQCNLTLTDIIRDFSFYPEEENKWERFYQTYKVLKEIPDIGLPSVNWYRSSFIRVEAIDKINTPSIPSPSSFTELYLDEETWATPLPPSE